MRIVIRMGILMGLVAIGDILMINIDVSGITMRDISMNDAITVVAMRGLGLRRHEHRHARGGQG